MLTLPYGAVPNCARAISSSLLGCLSSRTAPRRRVARAVENICRGHRSSLLTELWKPRSLTEAMRGDASELEALTGSKGEQSYGTSVTAPR